jgi:hypothetical protein
MRMAISATAIAQRSRSAGILTLGSWWSSTTMRGWSGRAGAALPARASVAMTCGRSAFRRDLMR